MLICTDEEVYVADVCVWVYTVFFNMCRWEWVCVCMGMMCVYLYIRVHGSERGKERGGDVCGGCARLCQRVLVHVHEQHTLQSCTPCYKTVTLNIVFGV